MKVAVRMERLYTVLFIFCVVSFCSCACYPDEVFLTNGDKISGSFLRQDTQTVVVETEAMGIISIQADSVDHIAFAKDAVIPKQLLVKEASPWEREISLGYDKTTGNTKKSQLSSTIRIYRKGEADEFEAKADTYYSSSDNKMDAQQYNGMIRYAYSLENAQWYKFYKLDGSHDRFANIDYRLVPSCGIGYWLSDTDDWKAMWEVGAGFEHTNYRDATKNSNEAVLAPRFFVEKALFDKARFSQDVILYPSLSDRGEYRMHAETLFTNPLSENLSLRLSFINDYNSDPSAGTKKHDARFISSLVYSF